MINSEKFLRFEKIFLVGVYNLLTYKNKHYNAIQKVFFKIIFFLHF